jgi:hypothetical protein
VAPRKIKVQASHVLIVEMWAKLKPDAATPTEDSRRSKKEQYVVSASRLKVLV